MSASRVASYPARAPVVCALCQLTTDQVAGHNEREAADASLGITSRDVNLDDAPSHRKASMFEPNRRGG